MWVFSFLLLVVLCCVAVCAEGSSLGGVWKEMGREKGVMNSRLSSRSARGRYCCFFSMKARLVRA